MGELIRLSDVTSTSKNIYEHSSEYSSLEVHYDSSSRELDIVVYNDDGEAITNRLNSIDIDDLIAALQTISSLKTRTR